MSRAVDRGRANIHLHAISDWAEEHVVDVGGRPVELQPWQRSLLEAAVPVVLATPRNPDRDKTSLAAVVEFGDVVVVATSRLQARRVYAEALRLVGRRR